MALLAPKVLDHVAKFAFERTTARRLQRSHQSPVIGIEGPARNGRARNVRLVADIAIARIASAQIGEEFGGDLFHLARDKHVAMGAQMRWAQAGVRAAHDDALAPAAELVGDRDHAPPLIDLSGDRDPIRHMIEVDGRDIFVTNGNLKILRSQRRNGRCSRVRHSRAGCEPRRRKYLRTDVIRKVGSRI